MQLLLGHTKIESTVRYLGVEVVDALAIAEQIDVLKYRGRADMLCPPAIGCFGPNRRHHATARATRCGRIDRTIGTVIRPYARSIWQSMHPALAVCALM